MKKTRTEGEGNRSDRRSCQLSQRARDDITTENEQNGEDVAGVFPLRKELARGLSGIEAAGQMAEARGGRHFYFMDRLDCSWSPSRQEATLGGEINEIDEG